MKFKTAATVPPFAITVEQFCLAYPVSRATVVNLIRSGDLESFTEGRRRLIPIEAARAYVKRKRAAGGAIPQEVRERKSRAGKLGKAKQIAEAKAESEAA